MTKYRPTTSPLKPSPSPRQRFADVRVRPILKARIDELARVNAVFRRQNDEIRHLDGLRRLGEQMLDCSSEAIIATDLGGKIIFWNSYAEKLYGWRSDEVLGQDVVRVVPAAAAVAHAEDIMAQLRKGEAWSGVSKCRRCSKHPLILRWLSA